MNLCFDISPGLAQTAGIGRYAMELALALHRGASEYDVNLSLFHNRQPLDRLPVELTQLPRSAAPLDNKAWRASMLWGLPLLPTWRQAIDGRDLFHGTDGVVPRLSIPAVITIHDLTTRLYPQYHTRLNRLYLRWALPVMVRRAGAVIADSESTRRDVIQYLGPDADQVSVVHLGVDAKRFHPDPATDDAALIAAGVAPPYILAVGTLEPRKNLPNLLRAYAELPRSAPPLVLVGGRGWGNNPLSALVEQLGLKERVRLAGYVAEELLPVLYSRAELFVYPSLYEGFGLPVLEAMACGTPVITSNVSSLPEVAGDAAVLVDPLRVDEISGALQTLLDSPQQRVALRDAGLMRARSFTWARCAQATVGVYRHVLEST